MLYAKKQRVIREWGIGEYHNSGICVQVDDEMIFFKPLLNYIANQ